MVYWHNATGGFYDSAASAQVPVGAVEITPLHYRELLDGQSAGMRIIAGPDGRPILADLPTPTRDQIEATICAAVQRRLDDFARSIGYDNILAACSYAASINPSWQQTAAYCLAARDDTWAALYTLLAADPPPDSYRDIEASLPVLALLRP